MIRIPIAVVSVLLFVACPALAKEPLLENAIDLSEVAGRPATFVVRAPGRFWRMDDSLFGGGGGRPGWACVPNRDVGGEASRHFVVAEPRGSGDLKELVRKRGKLWIAGRPTGFLGEPAIKVATRKIGSGAIQGIELSARLLEDRDPMGRVRIGRAFVFEAGAAVVALATIEASEWTNRHAEFLASGHLVWTKARPKSKRLHLKLAQIAPTSERFLQMRLPDGFSWLGANRFGDGDQTTLEASEFGSNEFEEVVERARAVDVRRYGVLDAERLLVAGAPAVLLDCGEVDPPSSLHLMLYTNLFGRVQSWDYRGPEEAEAKRKRRRSQFHRFLKTVDARAVRTPYGQLLDTILGQINANRKRAGLQALAFDPQTSVGAFEHSRYLARNPTVARGAEVHEQDRARTFATEAGRRSAARSIVIGGTQPHYPVQDAIARHMSTFYHRIMLLRPGATSAGIGLFYDGAAQGQAWQLVIELSPVEATGGAKPGVPNVVAYPADGQTDVSPVFRGEWPDPRPGTARGVSGLPVTLTFHGALPTNVKAELRRAGAPLSVWISTPSLPARPQISPRNRNTICLIAKQPLEPNQRYEVLVEATVGGQPFQKRWTFKTAG